MLEGGTIKDLGIVTGLHVQHMVQQYLASSEFQKSYLVAVDQRGVFMVEHDFDFETGGGRFGHDAILYRPEVC